MSPIRVGVVSDTHGRLPNAVLERFAGVQHIVHAGDVGNAGILAALEAVAPVTAVWGNTDGFGLRRQLPETATTEIGGRRIRVTHGHQLGLPTPAALRAVHPDADVVVFGHTHQALEQWVDGQLFLNPGSAGAPRQNAPATVGVLTVQDDRLSFELIELTD